MPQKPNTPYVPYKVDKENSLYVLVIYYHKAPTVAKFYYSKYVEKERTNDEQIQKMVDLIVLKRAEARTMILFQNNKKGTPRDSKEPDNEEYVRVHHGKRLDFKSSSLDNESRKVLQEMLPDFEVM